MKIVNYNPLNHENLIKVGDKEATVVQVSSDEIKIRVPEDITQSNISLIGYVPVSLIVEGQTSSVSDSIYIRLMNTWTKKKSPPGSNRWFAMAHAINGKGYYGFGQDYNYPSVRYKDIWEYDPMIDSWNEKEKFPGADRSHFASFVIGKVIYICGGKANGICYNDVWAYDTENNTWTRKNNFPGEAGWQLFGFCLNGKGYIGGGKNADDNILYRFWEYDPTLDEWSLKGTLPYSFAFNAYSQIAIAKTANNHAYLLGDGYGRSFFEYNQNQNSWEFLGFAPFNEGQVTMFSIHSDIYVATGSINTTDSRLFYKYNTETKTWVSLYPFIGKERRGACSFTINNQGYILGGVKTLGLAVFEYTNDMWMYDPNINQ